MGPDVMEKLQKKVHIEEPGPKIPARVLEELSLTDVCFPVFHGPQGEDGMMQGVLDALQVPYVGCDYRSCALCMDKGWTKKIAIMHHIPIAPFFSMTHQEYRANPPSLIDKIAEHLQYPVWIKPVHLGSSIGVSCLSSSEEVLEKAELAFSYDDCILVENHVEGKQIEFGVLGNEYVRVGLPCEILNRGAFVDYAGKYGKTAMPYAIPAEISELDAMVGVDLAKRVYAAAGCQGLARIDFFFDRKGHFWLNEINPFPGCTDTSAFPKIWAAAGVGMEKICDDLIACALQRIRKLQQIRGR